MVPTGWKNKDVHLELISQDGARAAKLEDITEGGVVLIWTENENERRVFYPWHAITAIELTDPEGPAKPRARVLSS